jgi:hypothetical protein
VTGSTTTGPAALTVPPTATIAKVSVNSSSHSVRFVLSASGTVSGFQCALVHRVGVGATKARPRYVACGAVRAYNHLAAGRYTFYARAIGPDGSYRTTVRRSFSIR